MLKPLSAAIGSALLLSFAAGTAAAQDAAAAPADTETAQADRAAVNLDNVVVTGTRSPKAVDKIPGAITLVSKAELARSLVLTEDATAVLARSVPGYAESSQAMSNTGENLRGRVALRLFDGVPQGSPLREGTRNGTFTDMGIVGRIEVINGPSASEGIGAAGGIINYLSAAPTKEGNEFTVISRYTTQFKDDSAGWKLGFNFARKAGNFDMLASASFLDRGITYDGDGRRIGMNTSGSLADTESRNLFLKAGYDFGEDGAQRIEGSVSHFNIEGKANYIQVLGCRPDERALCGETRTNTSERGKIFGSKAAINDFKQYQLTYTHSDFFGGTLTVNGYKADQEMRYLPENTIDRQDPRLGPIGQVWDQSEIVTNKKGLRTSWARPSLFAVDGLELRVGLDLVEDTAQQRLALTDRLWVPPMEYKSRAPWMQLSWDIGPVTLSGGIRREDGELHVDDYTTTWYRDRRNVGGGTLDYQENLTNFGAVWRIDEQWSVFGSYGEGFTLANVGIPLRNVNTPGNSVESIIGLQAVIFKNKEIGFNWRGRIGNFGISYYQSRSADGSTYAVDPVTKDYVLNRRPIHIFGFDVNGELRPTKDLRLNVVYSHVVGKTSAANGVASPVETPLGVLNIAPDKLTATATWQFIPAASVSLGSTSYFSRRLPAINEYTKGYTLFDLTANVKAGNVGTFSLGVENLFNRFYFLSSSQIDIYQNYFAGRGRTVSLTFSRNF